MSSGGFDIERFQRAFLLLLVIGISLAFVTMIEAFLSALLLAALATGLSQSLYHWVLDRVGGRTGLASALTLLTVLVVIIVPVLGFLGVVAGQALEVAHVLEPWLRERVAMIQAGDLSYKFDLPAVLRPYEAQVAEQAGKIASRVTSILFEWVTSATRGTAQLLFGLFIMLYAMFFFLRDGAEMLHRILYYIPLRSEDEDRMVARFVSVSRATLKGTVVIGIVQGGLAGIAFAVAGINGAAFWGTVMAVLSIIPGVGTALVWIPAAISLFVSGAVGASLGLTVWCVGVVGTVDNVLRPRLVGRDTQMSDLLILLSTLGGLILFGAMGIVIGPILAALFVTVWELYGEAFSDYLPEVDVGAALRPQDSAGDD